MEKNMDLSKSIKSIAIVGPECTGKSTLAQSLATQYRTNWVEEYAREYVTSQNYRYNMFDIFRISRKQLEMEDDAMITANDFLICDTNLIVSKIWSNYKFGSCPEWIQNQIINRDYDLHLLTDIDMPWVEDPLREHPDKRQYFFDLYKKELDDLGVAYEIISGNENERWERAMMSIRKL